MKHIIKVKSVKKLKLKCINCMEEVPKENVDEEGDVYHCIQCDTSALVPDMTYELMVHFKISEEVKSLLLSEEFLTKIGSMKLLLTHEYAIDYKDSTIISIEKNECRIWYCLQRLSSRQGQ